MSNKKILALFIIVAALIGLVVFLLTRQAYEETPAKVYRVGLLQMSTPVNLNIDGFKAGMKELGYIEGENITYDFLNAEGDTKLIVQYAQDLVKRKPDLIFTNTSPAAQAAKDATANSTIPVVFSMVADPVKAGFVTSIQSSENNLTGTSCAYIDIAGKRLEALKEAAPGIKKVLVFYRPGDKSGEPATEEIKKAGQKLNLTILAKPVSNSGEIKEILKNLKPGEVDALMDPADAMVNANVDSLVEVSLKLKIPLMMMGDREAEQGALVVYGVDYFDLGKQSARLADRVLKGVSPSEIPIEMPRIFRTVVNLKTAAQIGVTIPSDFLAKADRIIQ